MSRTSLIDLENLPEKSQAVDAMLGRVPNSYSLLDQL